MKFCADCGKRKKLIEFVKNKARSDGYSAYCKKCSKEYFRSYRKRNKDKRDKYNTRYGNSKVKFKSSKFVFTVDDNVKESEDGYLEVICYKCKTHFKPTRLQCERRHRAVKGMIRDGKLSGRQNNFYCSDECKSSCSVFHKKSLFTSQIPLSKKARCNQHLNKQALLESQVDRYGYNFCEKCGIKTNRLAIHHNLMVSKYPEEADNLSHQLLVCNNCHTHKKC